MSIRILSALLIGILISPISAQALDPDGGSNNPEVFGVFRNFEEVEKACREKIGAPKPQGEEESSFEYLVRRCVNNARKRLSNARRGQQRALRRIRIRNRLNQRASVYSEVVEKRADEGAKMTQRERIRQTNINRRSLRRKIRMLQQERRVEIQEAEQMEGKDYESRIMSRKQARELCKGKPLRERVPCILEKLQVQ